VAQRATSAAVDAAEQVVAAGDDPAARLALCQRFYRGDPRRRGYGRAQLAFLRRMTGRGVLAPTDAPAPGSAWWRAVDDRLLRDALEADLRGRSGGAGASRSVERWRAFVERPSAVAWYRAHNTSVVSAYLDHARLAEAELPAERAVMALTLARVLVAHVLVAAPHRVLGRLAPLGRHAGDPRGPAIGAFLSADGAVPGRYPLDGVTPAEVLAGARGRLARLVDGGLVGPRLDDLYDLAADALDLPAVRSLRADVPAYVLPQVDLRRDGPVRLLTRLTAAG
jgi:hypothetical protein